jgi:hypothetical protein
MDGSTAPDSEDLGRNIRASDVPNSRQHSATLHDTLIARRTEHTLGHASDHEPLERAATVRRHCVAPSAPPLIRSSRSQDLPVRWLR